MDILTDASTEWSGQVSSNNYGHKLNDDMQNLLSLSFLLIIFVFNAFYWYCMFGKLCCSAYKNGPFQ